MIFKVLPGTELYQKFEKLFNRIDEVNRQAQEVAKSFGATEWAGATGAIAGGITGIPFEKKPEGWKFIAYISGRACYYPLAKNKAAREKIDKLPTIDRDELNELIGFRYQTISVKSGNGLAFLRGYNAYKRTGCFLIEIREEAEFEPVPGMIEITASEYKKLKEQDPCA